MFIGVDIGLKGAIVILDSNGNYITSYKMPIIVDKKTKNKKIDSAKLTDILKHYQNNILCCELLHSMPGQGVSSMFKLGYNAGVIVGISNALMYKTIEVSPTKWQNYLHKIYFNDKIFKAFEIYNFDKISKTIKDETFKQFFNHISNLKSTKYTKLQTAYLYYLIDSKLSIDYKNDNLVDAYCIAHYNYSINTSAE